MRRLATLLKKSFVAFLSAGGVLCLSVSYAQDPSAAQTEAAPAEPTPALFEPQEEAPAQSTHILDQPIEQRREVLRIYNKLEDYTQAETIAYSILRDSPGDRETLSMLATMYLNQDDPYHLSEIIQRWRSYYPTDPELDYYQAALHMFCQKPEAALRIHRQNISGLSQQETYPHMTDVAQAALVAGDTRASINAYRVLLEDNTLTDDQRSAIRKILDDLYRQELGHIQADHMILNYNDGISHRSNLEWEGRIAPLHRARVTLSRDDIDISGTETLRGCYADRSEGFVTLITDWHRQFQTQVWSGAYDSGGNLSGVNLTYMPTTALQYDLRATYNEKAQDSLALEALDGRQHRLSLTSSIRLNRNDLLNVEPYVRLLNINETAIGESLGSTWSYEHVLVRLRGPFEWRVGYRGIYQAHNFRDDINGYLADPIAPNDFTDEDRVNLIDGLVTHTFHRHGAYCVWEGNITPPLSYSVFWGTDYDVSRGAGVTDRWVHSGGGQLTYSPEKDWDLTAGIEYGTGSKTSNTNTDALQLRFSSILFF